MNGQTGEGSELWLYAAAVAGECLGLGHALLPWKSAAAHADTAIGRIRNSQGARSLRPGRASGGARRSRGLLAVLLLAGLVLASVLALRSSPRTVEAAAGWELQSAPAGLPADCDFLADVWGTSPSDVYSVTWCGVLIHYDGSQWVSQGRIPMDSPDGVEPYISDLWGTSSDLFVLGGVNWHEHSIFRRSGGRWTQENIDNHDGSYSGIWGTSSRNVFAVGGCDVGIVNHYDGASWNQELDPTESTIYLSDVWGSSGSDVYAVGCGESYDPDTYEYNSYGSILHFGGTGWSTMTQVAGTGLAAVWGSSASNVFAVGSNGAIVHYDGTSWSPMSSGTTSDLCGVWGSSGSNVFAVGSNGAILHYDSSGWSPMSSGTTSDLSGVWGSGSEVFAVGANGTILRYVASTNGYAERPVNGSPDDGATSVSLTPTLQASAFADADGDSHIASRWQVRSLHGDYDSPVWDSGTTVPATSTTVPSGKLDPSTTYYWRVGYRDSHKLWSSYSKETSFTTAGGPGPGRPVNVSPANRATGVNLTPTLKSSAFAGADGGSHAASQWQVTTTAGSYAGALLDSGRDTVNLTQITLPTGILSSSSSYYWHVRHAGSGSSWSEWSAETAFTTLEGPTLPPAVITAPAASIGAGSARLNGELLSLGTASRVRVSFQWGTSPSSYPNETRFEEKSSAGAFFADLSGLAPGTKVYYRTKAAGDGTVFGTELDLTTGVTPPAAPSVVTADADGAAASSVRLRGDLTSLGTAGEVSVSFVWGYTKGGPYPNETAAAVRDDTGAFEFSLSGLASGTTFYYQAKAAGEGTVYGEEKSFVTTGKTPAGDETNTDEGRFPVIGRRGGTHLSVYLAAGLGGVVGLGILASAGVWVLRRRAS